MPNASLVDFRSKMQGGGARPNLFEVSIPDLPEAATAEGALWDADSQDKFRFLAKATNLPAANVAEVVVPFRGRNFKVAGDRTIDPWTVTIINDEDFRFRTIFEQWANAIAKLDNGTGTTNPIDYQGDAFVRQLGRGNQRESKSNASNDNMVVLREYKFEMIWPSLVSDIALSYDDGNAIEQFDVTFQVQTYRVTSKGERPAII